MSRASKLRSLPKNPQSHFIAEGAQIDLKQCCSFQPPEQWKIISERIQKPGKKFINIMVGNKKSEQSHQSSSRGIQSKYTMSRQLSHQSSRQLFQKVKKDFIEQLKLWKQQDFTIPQTQQPHTSRARPMNYHNHEPYSGRNPQDDVEKNYYQEEQLNFNEDENKPSRNWMIPNLNSIEEVGVNFQTSSGLKTQSSAVFSVFQS